MLALLRAELSTLSRKINIRQTTQLFKTAIDSAINSGFLNDITTTYERAAEFGIATGCDNQDEYLSLAHAVYQSWDAKAKANELLTKYPRIATKRLGSRIVIDGFATGKSLI